jgi:hypothetical protein
MLLFGIFSKQFVEAAVGWISTASENPLQASEIRRTSKETYTFLQQAKK